MEKEELEKRVQELQALEVKQKENLPTQPLIANGGSTLKDLQNDFLKKQVEQGKTLQEITADFAKASVTSKLLDENNEETEKYRKELAEEQKQTLKESFKQDKVKGQTETLSEKQKKAEAFYNSVRPILEFDFSNLIKKKKDKDVEEKRYADRSYGIPLMVGMLLCLTAPYFFISVILAFFNGINAILESISTFGNVSRKIVLSIVIIAVLLLLLYCAVSIVEYILNMEIIPAHFGG